MDLQKESDFIQKQKFARTPNELMYRSVGFISQIEPKKFEEANEDPQWIMAMQEELAQFEFKFGLFVKRPANYPNQVGIQKEAGLRWSKSQKQGKTCGSRLQARRRKRL